MNITDMNRDQLRKLAAELNIAGRGTMLKPQLVEAITAAQAPKSVKPCGYAVPLSYAARAVNYAKQTGSARMTPRQRRRASKKSARFTRYTAQAGA